MPFNANAHDEAAEMRAGRALALPCTYCRRPAGEPCWNKVADQPLKNTPAHFIRLKSVGY